MEYGFESGVVTKSLLYKAHNPHVTRRMTNRVVIGRPTHSVPIFKEVNKEAKLITN